jgi:hypothetical protein
MTKQLTQREKVLAFTVGGAVVLLLNIFVLSYFFRTQSQLRVDFARKQLQLAQMQALMRDADKWARLDTEVVARQPKLENEARAGTALLAQVQDSAKKNSVLIEQPAIPNPERRPESISVSVTVETKSTWEALIKFLHALQGPDQFIALESANLKVDTQDQTQMRGRFKIAKWFAPR